METKIVLVGGDIKTGRESSIANKIAKAIGALWIFNGSLPNSIEGSDLTIWMPDISNENEKNYPKKDKGSVLICSKVMRDGYTDADAISRIFRMQGNAVIKIYKDAKPYKFQLTDALGNNWTEKTDNIQEITDAIYRLYKWTKNSVRKSLTHNPLHYPITLNSDFVPIIQKVAKKVMSGCESRFFGNYSERCTKLFPSERVLKNGFLFSPRNVDKQFIEERDCVYCTDDTYFGDRKPSVDTPIQIEIYKEFPIINFMIHGHAYIKDAPITDHYYPCGDLREVYYALKLIEKGTYCINLKHHGFLIAANSIAELKVHADLCEFMVPDTNYVNNKR